MFWGIAADIYLPAHFDPDRQFPTIVVAHPIGSRKEQTSSEIYSAQLAGQGFIRDNWRTRTSAPRTSPR